MAIEIMEAEFPELKKDSASWPKEIYWEELWGYTGFHLGIFFKLCEQQPNKCPNQCRDCQSTRLKSIIFEQMIY